MLIVDMCWTKVKKEVLVWDAAAMRIATEKGRSFRSLSHLPCLSRYSWLIVSACFHDEAIAKYTLVLHIFKWVQSEVLCLTDQMHKSFHH